MLALLAEDDDDASTGNAWVDFAVTMQEDAASVIAAIFAVRIINGKRKRKTARRLQGLMLRGSGEQSRRVLELRSRGMVVGAADKLCSEAGESSGGEKEQTNRDSCASGGVVLHFLQGEEERDEAP